MKINYETANCCICKAEFKRRSGRSNPKRYCDRDKCQKIKKIKNTVVSLGSIPTPDRNPYREIRSYEGGYSE